MVIPLPHLFLLHACCHCSFLVLKDGEDAFSRLGAGNRVATLLIYVSCEHPPTHTVEGLDENSCISNSLWV